MPDKKPSYQELKMELDQLLDQLQADDIGVEAAMKCYERGMELIQELEKHLESAENKITKLKAKFDA